MFMSFIFVLACNNKKVQTVMVNNSTNIYRTGNHLSPYLIEHTKNTTPCYIGNTSPVLGQSHGSQYTEFFYCLFLYMHCCSRSNYRGWRRGPNNWIDAATFLFLYQLTFPPPYVVFIGVRLFEVRDDCSFCWYLSNCSPSQFKLSFLYFISMFVDRCLSFCTFYMNSDYPFGIFKLFFLNLRKDLNNEGRHGIIAYLACF